MAHIEAIRTLVATNMDDNLRENGSLCHSRLSPEKNNRRENFFFRGEAAVTQARKWQFRASYSLTSHTKNHLCANLTADQLFSLFCRVSERKANGESRVN